jgi:Ran GTPase-activating protein (RanGAP) involved in mRNA processing and transport
LNALIRALTDKRIRFLNLSSNFLTLEGVKIVSSFLKNNKTLLRLNLSRNSQSEFKSEGVQSILESLSSNHNIEFLDFSYMNLTGCGASVGQFLSSNKSLMILNLRSVQLNVVDFKNIFNGIKISKYIKELDISNNDMGGDKSLQYIADGIKENKSLFCLKIDKININNDNYDIIFDAIKQNKNITNYTVNYNSKINPKIMLNFFIKQMQIKNLEYEPYDKSNPEDQKKELTLEEKKLFERFKSERPDMTLIYK